MTNILVGIIDLYQKTLSPDHSIFGKGRFPHGYCRFYPSCSEYARQALLKHGTLPGIFKAAGRILRCNPFSAGGSDPIN